MLDKPTSEFMARMVKDHQAHHRRVRYQGGQRLSDLDIFSAEVMRKNTQDVYMPELSGSRVSRTVARLFGAVVAMAIVSSCSLMAEQQANQDYQNAYSVRYSCSYSGGVAATSFTYMEEAAELGNAQAQYEVTKDYLYGKALTDADLATAKNDMKTYACVRANVANYYTSSDAAFSWYQKLGANDYIPQNVDDFCRTSQDLINNSQNYQQAVIAYANKYCKDIGLAAVFSASNNNSVILSGIFSSSNSQLTSTVSESVERKQEQQQVAANRQAAALEQERHQQRLAYLADYQKAIAGTVPLASSVGTAGAGGNSSLDMSQMAAVYQQNLQSTPGQSSVTDAVSKMLVPFTDSFSVEVASYDHVNILFDGQTIAAVAMVMSPYQVQVFAHGRDGYKPQILFKTEGDTASPVLQVTGLLFTNGSHVYVSNNIMPGASQIQLGEAAAQPYHNYQAQQRQDEQREQQARHEAQCNNILNIMARVQAVGGDTSSLAQTYSMLNCQ